MAALAAAPSLYAQGAYKAVLDTYHIRQTTFCSSGKRELVERDITGAGASYSMTVQRTCIGSSLKLDISVSMPDNMRGNITPAGYMMFDSAPSSSARLAMDASFPDSRGYLANLTVPSPDNRAGCADVTRTGPPFKGSVQAVLTMSGCTRAQLNEYTYFHETVGNQRIPTRLQINTWPSAAVLPAPNDYTGPISELPFVAVEIDAIYRIEPVSADLKFDHMEVVQAVQDRDNTVPLIQGKPTVVRVFPVMAKPGEGGRTSQNNVTAQLRAYFRGNELALSPIQPYNGTITVSPTFDRNNADHSLNFRIPHIWTLNPNISFTAEIKGPGSTPDPTPDDNTGVTSVSLQASRRLNIAYLPLCLQSGAAVICPNGASIAQHSVYVEKTFPVSPASLTYTPLAVPQRTFNIDIAGGFGNSKLDAYLRQFYNMFASAYDQLAVWVPDLIPYGVRTTGSSDPLWYTADPGQGRVSWQQDWVAADPLYPARTLAHEIAHNLGRRHTHRVDSCGARDAGTDWPVDLARSNIQEPGFDPILRKIKPSRLFDLMTYCAPPVDDTWISPFTYQALLAVNLRPANEPARRLADGDWIVIGGSAKRDGSGGTLQPGIRVPGGGPVDPPPTTPTHCLRFFGEAGQLGEQCMVFTFHNHQDETVIYDEQFFSVKTPFPSGTTRIALFAGDKELAAISPGASTPVVTITSPATGDTWDGAGQRTLAWIATDADNDPLTYSVLYSSDSGANWLPMELDLTEPQYTFNPSQIAGGKAVMFRVLATDGINSGSADVGPVEVVQVPKIEIAVERLDHRKAVLRGFHDATFNIVNSGTGPLNITAITPSTEEFSLLSRMPIMIPAGSTFSLATRFEPARTGLREARLRIESSDPARPSVEIVLAGTGLAAAETDLEFSVGALDYGAVNVAANKFLPVTVRNHGPATSAVNAPVFNPGAFNIPGATGFQIPAGESRTFNIRFLPTSAGEFAGTATFTTDDPAKPTVRVALTGRGVVPDAPDMACTYRLGAAAVSVGAAAGSHTVGVTATEGCPWTATAIYFFTSLGENPGGTGNGTLTFNVTANTSAQPRAGYLLVAGYTLMVIQAGTNVRFSDSLNRANAEGCAMGKLNLAYGGTGDHYYIPVFAQPYASLNGATLRNGGQDYGGVQFTASATPCGPAATNKGETVLPDLNIRVAVRVPTDANNRVTQAGPYFRAKANAAGESILGANAAGFWVQLHSTGEVKVKNLATDAIIASSARPTSFDPSVFHVLEVAVASTYVEVALDGRRVAFTQNNAPTNFPTLPAIPPANTQNAAGIAFGAEGNRNQIGGQQAKDVIVTPYTSPGILLF